MIRPATMRRQRVPHEFLKAMGNKHMTLFRFRSVAAHSASQIAEIGYDEQKCRKLEKAACRISMC
jgi:hypothetical protein